MTNEKQRESEVIKKKQLRFLFSNLEADLEQIWLTTKADNLRMREQLHEMRVTS